MEQVSEIKEKTFKIRILLFIGKVKKKIKSSKTLLLQKCFCKSQQCFCKSQKHVGFFISFLIGSSHNGF